ncbi:MAG: TlpA family protein disulfide reductase [Planctomycetota bacterium]|jgi:hypothetical protein
MGFLFAQGGNRDVKVVLGQDRVHTDIDSMAGRALGDLKELNVDINPEEVKDKMVLVCFWSMYERASQKLVQRLGKRVNLLGENGVQVILAHVKGSDPPEYVNSWLKEHEINFPSGLLKGDDNIYRIRRAWGAKLLPWLILADEGHIVTAEGFGLDELEKKIKEAGDVEL